MFWGGYCKRIALVGLVLVAFAVFLGCPQTDSPTGKEEPQTETLPTLKVGTETATIAKNAQNPNALNVIITVPNGATADQINLTSGTNFTFTGKIFNFNITFASGVYNGSIVEAIKGQFTAKGALAGTVNTTPQAPVVEITLPSLTIGGTPANITQNAQNPNALDVTITVPNGATTGQINLTDGTNFAFTGKTFNFHITFASNTYDEAMVNAIKGKFTAKGAFEGTTITTPDKPNPGITAPTLKIDGIPATISVEVVNNVTTITVQATVSNGVITDLTNPGNILNGAVVNLKLSAATGQNNRINYTAIKKIEQEFESKGADAVSSDTASGAIPVFSTTSYKNGDINDDLAFLASKASAQKPDVKIVNNIRALYNNGNQILQVSSPMQLTGDIWCSQLDRIQTTQGNIYADETLRLWENGLKITLANFLATYAKCGFNLDGDNNFLPKTGFYSEGEISLEITDAETKSWDIYRLFAKYNDKGKLNNLTRLIAQNITVAGVNANGLYDTNNQPLTSFPYKVNGQIIEFMMGGFRQFENMYEDGTNPIPSTISSLKVKNFATESNLPSTQFYASGACFFQHAPLSIQSDGAVKLMQVGNALITVDAKYLDLRALSASQTNKIIKMASGGEIAFSEPSAAPSTNIRRGNLQYNIGYADHNSVTKLIGITTEGFDSSHASLLNTGIYGVLELQDWTGSTPPATQTAANFQNTGKKWNLTDFNALLSMLKFGPATEQNHTLFPLGNPLLAAILERKQRDMEIS